MFIVIRQHVRLLENIFTGLPLLLRLCYLPGFWFISALYFAFSFLYFLYTFLLTCFRCFFSKTTSYSAFYYLHLFTSIFIFISVFIFSIFSFSSLLLLPSSYFKFLRLSSFRTKRNEMIFPVYLFADGGPPALSQLGFKF